MKTTIDGWRAMRTKYRNPWYGKVKGAFGRIVEMPEFYEADAEPEKHAGCLIYARQEFGYPVYDVVVDGVVTTQRASLNGAKTAAEKKSWEWGDKDKGEVANDSQRA